MESTNYSIVKRSRIRSNTTLRRQTDDGISKRRKLNHTSRNSISGRRSSYSNRSLVPPNIPYTEQDTGTAQPTTQPTNTVHSTQTGAWRQKEKMQLEESNLEGAPVAKLTSSRTFCTPELRDTDCYRQNQPRCAERPTTIGSPCSAQYAWCDRWARYIRIPQFLLTRRRGDVSLNNLRAGSSKQEGNETYPRVILM